MERVELHREAHLYYAYPEHVGDRESDTGLDLTCGARYGSGQFETNRAGGSDHIDWWETLPDGITIRRHHCHNRKRLFTPLRANILPIGVESDSF